MPQFFLDRALDTGSDVEIRGADAKHIVQVLRLRKGDWLILSDGKGNSFQSEIISASSRSVIAHVKSLRTQRSPSQLVLAFAIIKHNRTETIIQKAIELGVSRIMPFHSQRTVPRLMSEVTERKLTRWQKIAVEAAKQSGLPFLPNVEHPIPFARLVDRTSQFKSTIMFWEGETQRDIRRSRDEISKDGEILVIIGPEGGFSSDEVELARSRGVITVSLGSQILRVETAIIAALSICQYEIGGFSIKES